MILHTEVTVRPGENALFVAEVKLEKGHCIGNEWWGLWLGWWLFPWREWRSWLWHVETYTGEAWFTWEVRVCGFEVTWQRKS